MSATRSSGRRRPTHTTPDDPTPVNTASAIWSRLDVPGHDACWIERGRDGWTVRGVAVFAHDDGPAALQYRVDCSEEWITRRGEIRGTVGSRHVEVSIVRDREGRWTLNGEEAASVRGLADLDFGFTPATNFQQLQRFALRVGQAADVTVAWLDVDSEGLTALEQKYERRDELSYWYESPAAGYQALLTIRADGLVDEYPGLWRAV